jgi:hypothetical protein
VDNRRERSNIPKVSQADTRVNAVRCRPMSGPRAIAPPLRPDGGIPAPVPPASCRRPTAGASCRRSAGVRPAERADGAGAEAAGADPARPDQPARSDRTRPTPRPRAARPPGPRAAVPPVHPAAPRPSPSPTRATSWSLGGAWRNHASHEKFQRRADTDVLPEPAGSRGGPGDPLRRPEGRLRGGPLRPGSRRPLCPSVRRRLPEGVQAPRRRPVRRCWKPAPPGVRRFPTSDRTPGTHPEARTAHDTCRLMSETRAPWGFGGFRHARRPRSGPRQAGRPDRGRITLALQRRGTPLAFTSGGFSGGRGATALPTGSSGRGLPAEEIMTSGPSRPGPRTDQPKKPPLVSGWAGRFRTG